MTHIITESLLQWDIDNKKPKKKEYLETLKHFLATEEQGKGTLHGHMLIWIKSLSDLRQHLFNDNGEINEEIINEIIKYFEPIKTTSFDYKEEKKVPLIKDIADSENIEESICVEVVI